MTLPEIEAMQAMRAEAAARHRAEEDSQRARSANAAPDSEPQAERAGSKPKAKRPEGQRQLDVHADLVELTSS